MFLCQTIPQSKSQILTAPFTQGSRILQTVCTLNYNLFVCLMHHIVGDGFFVPYDIPMDFSLHNNRPFDFSNGLF